MYCSTPASLKERDRKAEARKGYQIRKSIDLKIFEKVLYILSCKNAITRRHGLHVYKSMGHGYGVKFNGDVVYHAHSARGVTNCHLDYEWVGLLDEVYAMEKNRRHQNMIATIQAKAAVESKERSFG